MLNQTSQFANLVLVGKIWKQRTGPFLQRDYGEVSLNFDQTDMDFVFSHTPEKIVPAGKPERKNLSPTAA